MGQNSRDQNTCEVCQRSFDSKQDLQTHRNDAHGQNNPADRRSNYDIGKVKDIAGRVERQTGEWTDDPKLQVKGAAKQAEGKVQNTLGKAKDAAEQTADEAKATPKSPQRADETDTEEFDAKEARRHG